LIVAFGEALKLLEYLPAAPKVYTGSGIFGVSSSTQDREGTLTRHCEDSVLSDIVSRDRVDAVVRQHLLGKILQTPPKFSAIKIDGVSAHYRVRRGEDVVMKPRPVEVFSFEIDYLQLPNFYFRCSVGSGTYIRSLIDSLGSYLGAGAYVSELRRESIGSFSVSDACRIEGIDTTRVDLTSLLLPLEVGASLLLPIALTPSDYDHLSHGLTIDLPIPIPSPSPVYSAFLGTLCVGVLEVTDRGRLKFRKLLHRSTMLP
jgi:tRNA pseudouridine55 synthase